MQTTELLPYRINFENDSTATAPAQQVTISNPLSTSFDWSTFELTEIGFGDHFIGVPAWTQHFTTVEKMTYNGVTFDVHIEAGIHLATGEVYAHFQSLDPVTGLPPAVAIGFLPPEDGTGRGQGHVSYVIEQKAGLATGTEVRNIAQIVFDGQPPIATNLVDPHDPSQGTDPTKEALITIWSGPFPSVVTGAATDLTQTSATLNGTVNPIGYSSSVQFEYGPTTAYGGTAGATPSPVTGATEEGVTAPLGGLQPGTLYHYRLTATNSYGTWYGSDETFTTVGIKPEITSLSPASGRAGTEVTLAGVNFGATQGASVVKFNGVVASQVTAWSDTRIQCKAPSGARSGPVTVTTAGGTSNGVTFTLKHVITATADEHGTVSPEGSVEVEEGGSQTFMLIPLEAYMVSDVLVDSVSVGRPERYEFTDVKADHALSVSFTPDTRPTADAGPDQQVESSALVKLSGANSFDPDDAIVAYQWERLDGPAVAISSANAVEPTFTAPAPGQEGASILFRLTVTDQAGQQSQDTCLVNVVSQNEPPRADAGPDQAVPGSSVVTLDGGQSADVDGTIQSHHWVQQKGGFPVSLENAETEQTGFMAPDSWEGALSFLLTVTDEGGLRGRDTCLVNVSAGNTPPVAEAGEDRCVKAGDTVSLDGSGSSDAEGSLVSYRWHQTKGAPATLSNPRAASPGFTAPSMGPQGGVLEFELTVTDGNGLKAQDTCRVTVAGTATGTIHVALGPEAAVADGARWRLDEGEWHESGVSLTGLPTGLHVLNFKEITGWESPAGREVSLEAAVITEVNALYSVPLPTRLELPQAKGAPGGTVEVPVRIESAHGIGSVAFTVAFDPTVATLKAVRLGSFASGCSLSADTGTAGKGVVAIEAPQLLVGSGDLALLDFTVIGQVGADTTLTFENALLDEGSVIPELVNGSLEVGGAYKLSGVCAYYMNAGPIPGVTLSLTGDGSFTTLSDATGSFAFNDLPLGSYTLTPSKTDETGKAITAMDASYVLRHVVGLSMLNADQQIAADVNLSGTVSALDASFILRKTVGLINLPFVPGGKIWVFKPEQKSYEPLAANQTTENFAGILLGDVNGNWTTPVQTSLAVSPGEQIMSTATAKSTAVQQKIPALDGRAWIRAGTALKLSADEVSAPLRLQVLKGEVYSADIIVTYDAKRFQLTDVKAGPLAKEALVSYQELAPGRVRIALASAAPIEGTGDLATLQFKRKGSRLWKPVVQVWKAVFNDGIMKTIP